MIVPYAQSASMFGPEEIEAAKAVLDSGYMTIGRHVAAFEEAFAAWVGAPYAVMVNSGSSANLLAVDAMLRRSRTEAPWRAGDEVLVPALAWPTTVWPLVQLGLVPVFCDVDPATLALSLESAETVLTERTRGVFLIHVQGLTPDMEPYVHFCARHGLTLLEDSCETIGAHSRGRHSGTFGKVGTFSSYFSHHICTIEGGLIVTSDAELRDDLLSARSHGWARDRSDRDWWAKAYPGIDARFMFVTTGYNVRPTDLQGAIGCVQVRKLDEMLERRETIAWRMGAWLSRSAPWLRLVGVEWMPEAGAEVPRRTRRNSWMSMMMMLSADAPIDLAGLRAHLTAHAVESRPIIAGNLTRHPGARRYAGRRANSLAVADEVLDRGIMLGCHPYPVAGSLETLEAAFSSLGRL